MALENQTDSPVNQRWCISFKLNMFLDSFEHELGLLILHNKRSRIVSGCRLPDYHGMTDDEDQGWTEIVNKSPRIELKCKETTYEV